MTERTADLLRRVCRDEQRVRDGQGLWRTHQGDLVPVVQWPAHGDIVFTRGNVYAIDTDGAFVPLGPAAVCAAVKLIEELIGA